MGYTRIVITMKKLFFLIVAMFCMASCKSLPEKIEIFVSDVEENYKTYTEVDWLEKDQKFAEFKVEFAKKSDKLSQYEKDYIDRAFGRYYAVVAKSKVNGAVSGVKELFKEAGRYIEGLIEGINGADSLDTESSK